MTQEFKNELFKKAVEKRVNNNPVYIISWNEKVKLVSSEFALKTINEVLETAIGKRSYKSHFSLGN